MSRAAIIGTAVVIVAAAGGYFLQRSTADRGSLSPDAGAPAPVATPSKTAPTASVEPAGGAVAGHISGSDGDENSSASASHARPIPETLPDFSLPDHTGKPRTLSEWRGRPVIVNFWATWCGPCREEIPLLKTLIDERKADRLEVIGIAVDSDEDVKRFAREMHIEYPVLMGEKEGYEAAEAFGVSLVLPFSVFADRKGRIVTLKIGELHAAEAHFILDRVRDIDANRLDLPHARRQIADKLRDFAVERGKKAAEAG